MPIGNHDFDSQFNFDSTRFRCKKDALITFCFTRVSCDIQIRQPINDIKCVSALGDCITLCRSATVINNRILLKATSYFSPSIHYVWILRAHDCKCRESLARLQKSKILIICQENPIGELSSKKTFATFKNL